MLRILVVECLLVRVEVLLLLRYIHLSSLKVLVLLIVAPESLKVARVLVSLVVVVGVLIRL